MAVAAMQKQLAVAKEAAVAPVKKASALDEEAPEEEDAPKESAVEQGEDAVEGLLPPVKSGIKGGEGKVLCVCVCVCLRVHVIFVLAYTEHNRAGQSPGTHPRDPKRAPASTRPCQTT